MDRVLIVDGNAIARISYYATVYGQKSKGTDCFFNILEKWLRKLTISDAGLMIVWDGVNTQQIQKSGRTRIDKNYKANRKPDEDFNVFLEELICYCKDQKIQQRRKDGFEADDVMYSLSNKVVKGHPNMYVYILTCDSDMFQALEIPRVRIISQRENKVYDREEFYKEYGFPISMYIDWKSLAGDSSDNIKGVQGIGKKKADIMTKSRTIEQSLLDMNPEAMRDYIKAKCLIRLKLIEI